MSAQKNEARQFKPVKGDTTHKLRTNRFGNALTKRQHFRAMPEESHTIEDTLKPEYWAHIARLVSSSAIIEAFWEDGSRYAEYVVTAFSDAGLAVVLLRDVDLTKANATTDIDETDQFEVKFVNHHTGWCVIRKADNRTVSKDHKTKDAAYEWLATNKKQMGG